MENNNIKQGLTYGIVGGLIFLVLLFGLWAVGSVENFVAVTGVTTFIPYLFIILLVRQHLLVNDKDLSRINQAFFTTNGMASVILGSFIILDLFV